MDTQDKITQLTSFLGSDPTNINLMCDLVDLYFQVGPLSKAHELLSKATEIDNSNPRVHYQIAHLALANSDFEKAENVLTRLLEQGIDNLGVRYNLALALTQQGHYQKAYEILRPQMVNQQEAFLPADLLYLRLLHHQGLMQEALEYTETLLPNHADSADLHGLASILYLDASQQELAREHAKKALQLGSTSLESYCSMGTLELEEMEVDSAKQFFNQALEKQPKDGRSWLGKGLASLLETDLEQGRFCLEKATDYMPNHVGSWNCLSWIHIMRQDIDSAAQTAEIALNLDRNFSENHGTLAVVKVLQNKRDEAEELVKRALRLDRMSFSGNFAQTLLMDPTVDQDKINRRIQKMMSVPIVDGGISIEDGSKKYVTKFKDKRKLH